MNLTRTLLTGIVTLFTINLIFSANISILESQSIHPLHIMDENWQTVATNLGHSSTIVSQTSLDDINNFSNTDIIIIASGLIELPENRQETLKQFAEQGGNIYIQSEYLIDLPGNVAYQYLSNNLGGSFTWDGESPGSLAPMNITGAFASSENEVLTYFWYGTYGSGDNSIQPFLSYNGQDWGFIFCASDPTIGKIITTSDQDWIRTLNNEMLMKDIIEYFISNDAISALPLVTINETTENPCDSNNTMTFTATIDNNTAGIELQWMINGEIVTNETGITFTTDQLLIGDVVECRLFLAAFCTSYLHVSNPILIDEINLLSNPTIDITTTTTSFCDNAIPSFTAITTEIDNLENVSFQWKINGNPVNGATEMVFLPIIINDQDEVSCTLFFETDCQGNSSITSSPITVTIFNSFNPQATIEANQNSICEGETITFFVNGSDLGPNPSYQWQIDGTNAGNSAPVLVADNLSDGQNITCMININQTCTNTPIILSNTIGVLVNTMATPSISISANSTQICEGQEVIFTASGIDFGPNPTFQWQVNGQNVGNNSPVFLTTQLSDGQNVTCTLHADVTCAENLTVSSFPITVHVEEAIHPVITIDANTLETCKGEEVIFTATGTNHGTDPKYQWTINGTNAGTNQATFSTTDLKNNQVVICYLTNPDACETSIPVASNDISIKINDLELEVMELVFEHCSNADGFIEVTGVGGMEPYSYEWMNGATENALTGLSRGKFSVTITDAKGCQAIGQIEMGNYEAPQIAEIIIEESDCDGNNGSAEIHMAVESENYTFEWFNSAGTQIGFGRHAQLLTTGVYTVNINNEYGCETTEDVIIEQISNLQVTVGENLRIDLGENFQLEAIVNSNEVIKYEWSPAIGLSCTDCPKPTVNTTESVIYSVTVTNEYGCTATDEITVHIIPKRDIFIPNAFSPNGDGANDYFTVFTGDNVNAIKTLRVFDRWGAEIFGKTELSPNTETEGWDGTYKGRLMEAGVYVYYVEVEYIDGKTKIHSGDISITF